MKKHLLSLVVLCGLSLTAFSQTMPSEKVVLNVAADATSVKFTFRLTDNSASLLCDFGAGEVVKSFPSNTDGSLTVMEYTFTTPSAAERTITIAADKLKTLRLTSSKTINGINEVRSSVLKDFNADYVSLATHGKVDVSLCPVLSTLTLTDTDASEVILPQSDHLKTVQVSTTLLQKGSLTSINLTDVPNLEDLLIKGASIDTLDLRNNKELKVLVCSFGKKRMRAILGAKALQKIERLDVRGNALGFDQIPDRVLQDVPIEQFQYTPQRAYHINPACINGYTIDLSALYTAKGIVTTNNITTFRWRYKNGKADKKWKDVPADKVQNALGKFTFDPSLAYNDSLTLYVSMSNPGYPNIGSALSNNLLSVTTYIPLKPTGIQTAVETNLTIARTAEGISVETDRPEPATLWNIGGQQVWQGTIPAVINLDRGLYILRTESGKRVKFMR